MQTAEVGRPAAGRREKAAPDYPTPRNALLAGAGRTRPAGLFDSLKSAATRCLREVGRTARVVGEQPVRLVRYGQGLWRGHTLKRAAAAARLALGERMYAAGVDDGRLGAQIAAVDGRRRAGGDLRRA